MHATNTSIYLNETGVTSNVPQNNAFPQLNQNGTTYQAGSKSISMVSNKRRSGGGVALSEKDQTVYTEESQNNFKDGIQND